MGRFIAKYLLALVLLAIFNAGPAHALDVEDIRFGAHSNKTRVVFDLSEKTDFRVFLLTDPWRMVIDMPDFNWQVNAVPTPTSSGVKSIRQGALQPGTSRIVVDMNKPVIIKAVFFLPQDKGAPDRLVVDFAPATKSEFMAQKGKVYGRLKVDGRMQEPAVATAPSTRITAPSAIIKPPTPPKASPTRTTSNRNAFPPKKPARVAYEKPTIIIDAGHGGIDPGATTRGGLSEKNITLAMAKELKRQLEASGRYKVKLTRDRDTYLRLHQRVNFAREHKGDLFISLHADSLKKSSVRGASIYTLSENASDAQTERLAMRENRADLIAGIDLSAEDELVVNILVDLTMRDTMNQSNFLANTLVDSLRARSIKTLENPHRSAGFAVLKAPDVPSILIEMGFMSNGTDAKMLSSSTFRQKLAKALTASIDAYFEKVRRNSRT